MRFRSWFEQQLDNDKLRHFLSAQGLIFFFSLPERDSKKKEYYGATEESRVLFARMKNPDEDTANWRKEATFEALNIKSLLAGEKQLSIIGYKDMKKMEILDIDEVVKAVKEKND